jgi:hypothetical protein
MPQLPFLDPGYTNGPVRDFWKLKYHDIPNKSGVYILMANPGITFLYPRYKSPVFYVGQAVNLRNRLYGHLRAANEAKYNRKETLYWPYYEYAATLGARYTIILCENKETPKKLESDILACFAERYRSWPVANGVGGWESLLTLKEIKKRKRRVK